GCGNPEGYAWKRIDYAWTPPTYLPIDIQRWAMNPPGDASPSDHYGIIVTLPYPGAAPGDTPPPAATWTSVVNAAATGSGVVKTDGTVGATDVFRIAVEGTTVEYSKNGELVYTSGSAAISPLFVDTSLNTIGATISSALVK